MSVPKELQLYIWKIFVYIDLWFLSFLALFVIRIILTASLTPIFGEESAF
jgi:hypothetical protein